MLQAMGTYVTADFIYIYIALLFLAVSVEFGFDHQGVY